MFYFFKSTFKRTIVRSQVLAKTNTPAVLCPCPPALGSGSTIPHPCEWGDVLLSSDGKIVLKDRVFLVA